MYAKDLLDPDASPAVMIPVRTSIALFVLPPAIAFLPLTGIGLLIFQNETSVWVALAPGIIVGGPLVLLAGTPGYLLTDRPKPDAETEGTAPVMSTETAPVSSSQ